MADLGKIEYRVKQVTRFVITRHHESASGATGGASTKGEYENADVAYEVAYALAKAEADHLGLPPGDERMQYPVHPNRAASLDARSMVGMTGKPISAAALHAGWNNAAREVNQGFGGMRNVDVDSLLGQGY